MLNLSRWRELNYKTAKNFSFFITEILHVTLLKIKQSVLIILETSQDKLIL